MKTLKLVLRPKIRFMYAVKEDLLVMCMSDEGTEERVFWRRLICSGDLRVFVSGGGLCSERVLGEVVRRAG